MYPPQLCSLLGSRLHELSQSRRWPQALAQCWHAIAFSRTGAYHQAASLTDRISLDQSAHDLTHDEAGLATWRASQFAASITHQPLVLLRALALLAAGSPVLASGIPAIQLPHEIYTGGVMQCEVFQWSTDWKATKSSVFLVRAASGRTDVQAANLHAYTSPYHLVPDTLDGLKIQVTDSGSTLLDERFHAIRASGRAVRVYVAEFLYPLDFIDASGALPDSRWNATGLKNEAQIEQLALAHLNSANAAGCDVVIYPELAITPKIQRAIQLHLLTRAHIASARKAGADTVIFPEIESSYSGPRVIQLAPWADLNALDNPVASSGVALVICGSFHHPNQLANGYSNVAYALDGAGNVVPGFTHRKLTFVSIGGHQTSSTLNEAIELGDTLSLVATPIGLLCSCICLDLAQKLPGYVIPLSHVPFTFMFVPSLSRNTNAHQESAKDILRNRQASVICANQGPAIFRAKSVDWIARNSFVMSSVTSDSLPAILSPTSKFNPYSGGKIFDVPVPTSAPTAESLIVIA